MLLHYCIDGHGCAFHLDDEGAEFASLEATGKSAIFRLHEIARWAISVDGDNRAFTVLVRDEGGAIGYTVTLT